MNRESNHTPSGEAEIMIGIAGLPVLPLRDPPIGRHFVVTIAKVKRDLLRCLPDARLEAAAILRALIDANTPAAQIDDARQLLNVMRHAKGPLFQALLLAEIKVRKIEAVIAPEQSPLERAHELAAGIAISLNRQPRGVVERAIGTLHKPLDPSELIGQQEQAKSA